MFAWRFPGWSEQKDVTVGKNIAESTKIQFCIIKKSLFHYALSALICFRGKVTASVRIEITAKPFDCHGLKPI
jgi:hypothetical protein